MTTTRYVVLEGPGSGGAELRGDAHELWRFKGPEAVLSGPAETGKTTACLTKLHAFLCKYGGAQAVMVRKVRDTIFGTVLQTYLKRILPDPDAVRPFGGERPQWFDYPNGSRLWLAGMDDPGKALSSERDFVYVNQAEELRVEDWETLTTRTTGRAGNAPYGQCVGDCNPGPPWHWIKQRPGLKVFESRHEDNPALHDGRGWTEQGRRTLAVLDALTGVRRERLRFGRWVSAEGTVYQFDPARHVCEPFPLPPSWPRVRSVDFGFTNPFVCLWGALDPDGRLHVYREWYKTGWTVQQHAARVKALSGAERFEATVSDHDREDRETLHQCGVWTEPAVKDISRGIQAVEDRLKNRPDGRPGLLLFRNALVERDESLAEARKPVCLEQEMDAYSWPKTADGRPVKETPVDKDNHSCDALRYMVMWADARQRAGSGKIGFSKYRSPFAGAGFRGKPKGGW